MLCGSSDYKVKINYETNIVICNNCGLVYANPRISDSKNTENFIGQEDFDVTRYNLLHDYETLLFQKELSKIEKLAGKGRILDVGCGNGVFLDTAGRRGWETYGVDINPSSFEPCSKFGKIFTGTIEEAKYPDNFFDVIFSSSTFYYLTNPVNFLIESKRILKKGGLVVITGIPNVKSLDARISFLSLIDPYPPVQVSFYFDKLHLKKLIAESGLSIKLIENKGFGNSVKYIFTRDKTKYSFLNEGQAGLEFRHANLSEIRTNRNLFKQAVKPFINCILRIFNLGYHYHIYLTKD